MIVDLFAGPGGWSTGLNLVGRAETVGVEWDAEACATARAAGHERLHGDVAALNPLTVVHDRPEYAGEVEGLIGSTPCPGFSNAGLGLGRKDLDLLRGAIADIGSGVWPEVVLDTVRARQHDDRSALTLEPLRWALALDPVWIVLEQVPAVLPLWEAYAEVLRSWGYSVWTGNVQAEQYGVPQTRKRAILTARRDGIARRPVPTHSRYHTHSPERIDAGMPRWVSMAEALSWGMTARPYPTVAAGAPKGAGGTDPQAIGGSGARAVIAAERAGGAWVEQPEGHPLRDASLWEMGDVRSANGCVRPADAPAPTMTASMDNGNFQWRARVAATAAERANNQSGTEFDLTWPCDRPAPVIAGRGLVTMPGANANRFNGSTKSRNDGLRVTVQEAGVLQSFPVDYPWQGGKTAQYRQVGDAVPPLLAAHVLASVGAGLLLGWEPTALPTVEQGVLL